MKDVLRSFDEYLTPEKKAEIAEGFRQSKANHKALDQRFDHLVKEYPMQWAGMKDGELFIDNNIDDLLKQMGDARNAAVRWLHSNPPTLILFREESTTFHEAAIMLQ